VDNALQALIGLLTGHDSDLQLEAAWCITNISAGMHEHASLVLRLAAPYLITYLSSGNSLMQDQCAWALGNVAGDSAECRDTLKKQGVVEPLISLLKVRSFSRPRLPLRCVAKSMKFPHAHWVVGK
jgi:hypothetical protein